MSNEDLTLQEIFDLAVQNHQNNNLQIAQNYYHKALKMDPNFTAAHYNLGDIFTKLGEILKAKDCYEKAIEINPGLADAHNNLGIIFDGLGENQKAKDCFEKAIEINPGFINAYNNLGVTFKELGENQKAKDCFEKAIEINPGFVDAHFNLGVIFKELGENQKAKDCYEKTIELNPNHVKSHSNLGGIFKDLGENLKAIGCYEKVIAIDPNYADAHNNLGFMYGLINDNKRSVNHYHKALAKRSDINFEIHKERDQELQPATSSFFLELTNKCNFHCEFCPSDSQTRLHGYMEMSLVKKILDEISQKKIVPRINLHLMGEPTLHPKLNEILAYAKSKSIKTDLTTNGSTLVKKRVPKLLDNISGTIVASLMTPTEETYQIRGDVGLSWDRYIDNFRLLFQEHLKKILKDDKIEYEIIFRVMVSNESQKGVAKVLGSPKGMQEIYNEWSDFTENVEKELGLTTFDRQIINPDKIFTKLKNQTEVSFYLQKNIKIQFWTAFTFANTRVSDEFKLEPKEKTQFCPHPFTDFGVLWNGDVSLCCLDYDATLKVGNVNTHSVEDVMKNKASNKLRASMHGLEKLHPTCVKCQSQTVENK